MKRRIWLVAVGTTLAAILALAGAGAGGYFIGQSTRQSDDEVAERLSAARTAQSDADRDLWDTRMKRALTSQKKTLTRKMEKRVERASEQGWASGQATGYASGQQQGYASGEEEGIEEGLEEGKEKGRKAGQEEGYEAGAVDGYVEGFDEGTCYEPGTYDYVC